MTGRVKLYVPAARRGILQTNVGEEVMFSVSDDVTDVQGGDIVEFEPDDQGHPLVGRIRVRHRWVDMLNSEHRTLVNQFHHTIHIHC